MRAFWAKLGVDYQITMSAKRWTMRGRDILTPLARYNRRHPRYRRNAGRCLRAALDPEPEKDGDDGENNQKKCGDGRLWGLVPSTAPRLVGDWAPAHTSANLPLQLISRYHGRGTGYTLVLVAHHHRHPPLQPSPDLSHGKGRSIPAFCRRPPPKPRPRAASPLSICN